MERAMREGSKWRVSGPCYRSQGLRLVLASGCFIDTSSVFTNPTLGTRKDDPKARYSLVIQAIEAFDSESLSSSSGPLA